MFNRAPSSFLTIHRLGLSARGLCTNSRGIWRRPSTLERELSVAEAEALDPIYKELMNEVRDWDRLFKEIPRHPWWRRKSGLEVLSLLLVHDGEKYHAFRGSNIEPSTPTGSLCAERLSIGRAVCDLPNIRRADFRAIAVWCPGETNEEDEDEDGRTPINPIDPCGVCEEWIKKIVEESEQFVKVSFTSTSLNTMIITYNHEETEIMKSVKGERKCVVCGAFPIIVSATSKNAGLCPEGCELDKYNEMDDAHRQILKFFKERNQMVTLEGIVNRIRENGSEHLFCEPLLAEPDSFRSKKQTKQETAAVKEIHQEIKSLKAKLIDEEDPDDSKTLQRLAQLKGELKNKKQLRKAQAKKERRMALEQQWPTSLLLEKVEVIVAEMQSPNFPLIEKTKKKKKRRKAALKLTELGRLLQEWKLKEKRSELLNQSKT